MKIVGITGSIGMGKTTVLRWLTREGWPCLNSDRVVHGLLQSDPGVRAEIDRQIFSMTGDSRTGDSSQEKERPFLDHLRHAVSCRPELYDVLEKILHPYVFRAYETFIRRHRGRRSRCIFLEVPLLFEVNLESLFDHIIVVASSPFIQHHRAMKRPGMTAKRLSEIQKRQTPQGVKIARADFLIYGGGISKLAPQIQHVLHQIMN